MTRGLLKYLGLVWRYKHWLGRQDAPPPPARSCWRAFSQTSSGPTHLPPVAVETKTQPSRGRNGQVMTVQCDGNSCAGSISWGRRRGTSSGGWTGLKGLDMNLPKRMDQRGIFRCERWLCKAGSEGGSCRQRTANGGPWLENWGDEAGDRGQAVAWMNHGPRPQAAWVLLAEAGGQIINIHQAVEKQG